MVNLCSLAPLVAMAEDAPYGPWAVGCSLLLSELFCPLRWVSLGLRPRGQDSYLVDSASSHMLVSKIKPCMSKYKQYIP